MAVSFWSAHSHFSKIALYEQVHRNSMSTVRNSGHFLNPFPLDTHLACWKCILAHQVSRPISEYFCSSRDTRFSHCSTKYSLVQDPGRVLLVKTCGFRCDVDRALVHLQEAEWTKAIPSIFEEEHVFSVCLDCWQMTL